MIILTDAMRKAISDAVNNMPGGQAELGRRTNIFQQNFSRYISGQTTRISERMWDQIYPYVKQYLPEGYEPAGLRSPPPGVVLNVQKDYREYLRYCLAILEQDESPDNIKITLLRQYIESLLT